MLGIQASALSLGSRGAVFSNGAGLTATQVGYGDAAGKIAGDAGLTYIAASDLLVVNHNASALPAIPAANGTVIQMGGLDATATSLLIDTAANFAAITGRRCNTTMASPSALASGDNIVAMAALGYGATGYTTSNRGVIAIQAAETWSDTAQGTKMVFSVTTPTTLTGNAAMTLSTTNINQIVSDAATTTSTNAYNISHITSGTAGVGFGSFLQIQGYDDGSTTRTMGNISCAWTDAASATRTSKLTFNTIDRAASIASLVMASTLFTQLCSDAATNSATTIHTFNHTTSGTVANGFGSTLQIQGHDDGATLRVMAQISSTWTTAATATRTSKIVFNVVNSATTTTALTLAGTSATFAAGFPLTCSDTTASTSVSTGAIITSGGIGVAKNVTVAGTTGASFRIATVTANASVAVTLGSTGPTGSTAGAPQGWMLISANGTDRYIPFW